MKSIFKSRTFWFNTAALAYVYLAHSGVIDPSSMPIDPQWQAALALVGNLALRYVTSQGVTFSSK